jgi:hypothetical protein
MTNVVGILIVLMAVTQLTISDAMERIQNRAESGLAPAQQKLSALEEQWAKLASADASGVGQSEALDRQLRALREEPELRALLDTSPADIARGLGRSRARVGELEKQIAEANEELANLQIRIDEEDSDDETPPVRLPDPRPPPVGARQRVVLCRYQRCFHVDWPALVRSYRAGVEAAVGVPPAMLRLGQASSGLKEYFDKRDIGSRELRVRIDRSSQYGPTWRLEWRSERQGETPRELRGYGSKYRGGLLASPPTSHYLLFAVWSDSFTAYLAAREIAERAGYSVGWEPWQNEFTRSVLRPPRFADPTPVD